MDTTRFYTTAPRRGSWIASPAVLRALALSVLLGASITATLLVGEGASATVVGTRVAHAAEPPRVERSAELPASAMVKWAADDSALGTQPDRAH